MASLNDVIFAKVGLLRRRVVQIHANAPNWHKYSKMMIFSIFCGSHKIGIRIMTKFKQEQFLTNLTKFCVSIYTHIYIHDIAKLVLCNL